MAKETFKVEEERVEAEDGVKVGLTPEPAEVEVEDVPDDGPSEAAIADAHVRATDTTVDWSKHRNANPL